MPEAATLIESASFVDEDPSADLIDSERQANRSALVAIDQVRKVRNTTASDRFNGEAGAKYRAQVAFYDSRLAATDKYLGWQAAFEELAAVDSFFAPFNPWRPDGSEMRPDSVFAALTAELDKDDAALTTQQQEIRPSATAL